METLRNTSRTTLLAFTVVLDTVALACGYWLVAGGDDEVVGWLIASVVGAIIAAALFLRFIPATESEPDDDNVPAKRGLVLAIVSLITCLAFWTGAPIVIRIPALVLAAEGHARAPTQGRGSEATAAAVISGFAVLATTILLVTAT